MIFKNSLLFFELYSRLHFNAFRSYNDDLSFAITIINILGFWHICLPKLGGVQTIQRLYGYEAFRFLFR